MKILLIIILLIQFYSVNFYQNAYPKREFRGAWIATVKNIDWPSSNKLSSGEQIRELVNILDKLSEAGINAVFFQIRTECDALYDSKFEPWSYWLTGEQGKRPRPYFDPLEFVVYESHRRGMEVHAWLNPYRAIRSVSEYETSPKHISQLSPEWILNFDDYAMLNPGIPAVRDHILNVVNDVIENYDIDGIHLDDYFYPYTPKITNEDSITFLNHSEGIVNIDDWRRNNINMLIGEIYELIQVRKPFVKFGVSPFGIVQNKYGGTNGFDSFSSIYCDPINWIENDIIDYITPQIYWEIGHEKADYAKLLPWWASISRRHLYIGMYSSKMAHPNYEGSENELGNQIRLNRKTDNVDGQVFFSAKSIFENYRGLADSMKSDWYTYPAIPPVMEWKNKLEHVQIQNTELLSDSSKNILTWSVVQNSEGEKLSGQLILYRVRKNEKPDFDNPSGILSILPLEISTFIDFRENNEEFDYYISALDRLMNESDPILFIETYQDQPENMEK